MLCGDIIVKLFVFLPKKRWHTSRTLLISWWYKDINMCIIQVFFLSRSGDKIPLLWLCEWQVKLWNGQSTLMYCKDFKAPQPRFLGYSIQVKLCGASWTNFIDKGYFTVNIHSFGNPMYITILLLYVNIISDNHVENGKKHYHTKVHPFIAIINHTSNHQQGWHFLWRLGPGPHVTAENRPFRIDVQAFRLHSRISFPTIACPLSSLDPRVRSRVAGDKRGPSLSLRRRWPLECWLHLPSFTVQTPLRHRPIIGNLQGYDNPVVSTAQLGAGRPIIVAIDLFRIVLFLPSFYYC